MPATAFLLAWVSASFLYKCFISKNNLGKHSCISVFSCRWLYAILTLERCLHSAHCRLIPTIASAKSASSHPFSVVSLVAGKIFPFSIKCLGLTFRQCGLDLKRKTIALFYIYQNLSTWDFVALNSSIMFLNFSAFILLFLSCALEFH